MKVWFRDSALEPTREVSEHAEFCIENDEGDWIHILVRDGMAEISANRHLIVQPRASNVIAVRPERFDDR
jgi:hypothetical protein